MTEQINDGRYTIEMDRMAQDERHDQHIRDSIKHRLVEKLVDLLPLREPVVVQMNIESFQRLGRGISLLVDAYRGTLDVPPVETMRYVRHEMYEPPEPPLIGYVAA